MNWLQRTSGSKESLQRMCLLKVILLHKVALGLEMGKLRKHDNLSSVVSKHGLAACVLREEEQCRVLLAAGLWLRAP